MCLNACILLFLICLWHLVSEHKIVDLVSLPILTIVVFLLFFRVFSDQISIEYLLTSALPFSFLLSALMPIEPVIYNPSLVISINILDHIVLILHLSHSKEVLLALLIQRFEPLNYCLKVSLGLEHVRKSCLPTLLLTYHTECIKTVLDRSALIRLVQNSFFVGKFLYGLIV